MTAQFILPVVLVSVLALSSCGGSTPPPTKPAAPAQKAVDEPAESKEKSGPDCSDGTCIVCGDAQCPRGFFCDESATKASCQWVPTCTDSVTCACVERALAGKCTCSERAGGAYVRCSD